MSDAKKIRELIKELIKENFMTPFNQMPDTEMLDSVSNDNLAFIGRNPTVYNWFITNRIQLIGNQIWVRMDDKKVKHFLRKIIGIQKK
jgi:hypothetical protein